MTDKKLIAYKKPVLVSLGNVKEVTFECPAWQCSVTVPPPPPAP